MPSAGFLIYSGVMPLIKTYAKSCAVVQCELTHQPLYRFLTIIAGYVLAKMDLFPKAASRGASQVTMNMALPALIFASVVPAFTPANVSAVGPLFLVAFTYQAIGFLAGYIIREVCYVPRNFWQGIIVLTGMSNWGNLRQYQHLYDSVHPLTVLAAISHRGRTFHHPAATIRPCHG